VDAKEVHISLRETKNDKEIPVSRAKDELQDDRKLDGRCTEMIIFPKVGGVK